MLAFTGTWSWSGTILQGVWDVDSTLDKVADTSCLNLGWRQGPGLRGMPIHGGGAVITPTSRTRRLTHLRTRAYRQLRFQPALQPSASSVVLVLVGSFIFKTYFAESVIKSKQISPSHTSHTQVSHQTPGSSIPSSKLTETQVARRPEA